MCTMAIPVNAIANQRSSFFRILLLAAVFGAWVQLLWLPSAQAEPTQAAIAAARMIFTEALELEKQATKEKDSEKARILWKKALEKVQRVGQVKMTPQVRYHIALCQEQVGQWVNAINNYERAAQEARDQGAKGWAVMASAPGRAKTLRGRVGHVTLTVEGTVRTSKIILDGKELPMALLGTEIPLDPGEHKLLVVRGDETIFEKKLVLSEKQKESIQLQIDDPEPLPEPVKPVATATGAKSPADVVEEGPSRWPAYLVGGVGVAALGVSALTFGLGQATIANVRFSCDEEDKNCDPDDKATAGLAEQYVLTSRITLGVGAGLVATGTVLWFVLGSKKKKKPEPPKSAVWLVPTWRGAAVFGSF